MSNNIYLVYDREECQWVRILFKVDDTYVVVENDSLEAYLQETEFLISYL